MRCWERRILEAATICIARVIFRVFSTLRIFTLISLVLGIVPILSMAAAGYDWRTLPASFKAAATARCSWRYSDRSPT
jgi:hypothetical protein